MKNLLNELKEFKYIPNTYHDGPDDHAADAMRYFLINARIKPKKSTGQKVVSVILRILLVVFIIVAALFWADVLNLIDFNITPLTRWVR